MKLKQIVEAKGNNNQLLKGALEYYASRPQLYSYSRDVLAMLHGWFKHEDPEVAALLEKILAHTKEKDMKAQGF